eukprot:387914-Prymnesium_polylepis.1
MQLASRLRGRRRHFVGTTASKPARALTKERKNYNIIFQALLFRARSIPTPATPLLCKVSRCVAVLQET